jgi:signal transduction histidine kinase
MTEESLPNPGQIDYHCGLRAYQDGNITEAIAHLSAAIDQDRTSAEYYGTRGLFYLEHNQKAEAALDFQQALKLDNRAWLGHYGLGMLSLLKGDFAAVLKHLTDGKGCVGGRLMVLRTVSEEIALKGFFEEVTDVLIHDLRSPLTGVSSSLHLAKELLETQDYEDIDQVIDIALDGSTRQLNMIEALIDIRRLERRETLLNFVACDLRGLAEKAVSTLRVAAAEAEVQVNNLIPADFPPVYADENLTYRIFFHLLDNALRHTPNGGTVRIEAAQFQDKPSKARIVVTDGGKGVPPELRQIIFDKFIQVTKSAVRGRRGRGLGLTLCRLAVETQNGKIWVENGPEGGALFIFTLPIRK